MTPPPEQLSEKGIGRAAQALADELGETPVVDNEPIVRRIIESYLSEEQRSEIEHDGLTVLEVRRRLDGLPTTMAPDRRDEIRAALCEHFEAMRELMVRLGHGPVSALELRLGGRAYDSEVVYRWDRQWTRS